MSILPCTIASLNRCGSISTCPMPCSRSCLPLGLLDSPFDGPRSGHGCGRKLAERDWILDTQGGDVMGYDEYARSIFEIVDTWSPSLIPLLLLPFAIGPQSPASCRTSSLDAEEYVEFLSILYNRIALQQYPGPPVLWCCERWMM